MEHPIEPKSYDLKFCSYFINKCCFNNKERLLYTLINCFSEPNNSHMNEIPTLSAIFSIKQYLQKELMCKCLINLGDKWDCFLILPLIVTIMQKNTSDSGPVNQATSHSSNTCKIDVRINWISIYLRCAGTTRLATFVEGGWAARLTAIG